MGYRTDCFPPIAKDAMDGARGFIPRDSGSKAAGVCGLLPTHRKRRDGWGTGLHSAGFEIENCGCLRLASILAAKCVRDGEDRLRPGWKLPGFLRPLRGRGA